MTVQAEVALHAIRAAENLQDLDRLTQGILADSHLEPVEAEIVIRYSCGRALELSVDSKKEFDDY